MEKRLPIWFLLFFATLAFSQISDLIKMEYTYIPKANSNVGYDRIRALFNYPVKLSEDSFCILGLDYSNIDISFDSSIDAFDTEIIEDFQLLDINFGYIFKMNKNWWFGVRITPGFSSNLVKSMSFDDAVFSGDIIFFKNKKKDPDTAKPYRLIMGISYSENRGIPFPIPFISYYRKFRPNWSFNLGVPKSNLQYHASEKSRFKLFAKLDGFTANIQDGIVINNNEIAERINMSIVVGGLSYEYHLGKYWELFCNFANIFFTNAELRDRKNDDILSVNKDNTLYLKTGLRFKI
ncbi:hypothetical protein DKG77_10650 [Flagellimonas aquimarina]|uniref:DUF6268 domain-containing protein n=1 Tax=Flagellimonas aquimarina TaxID=2201895 RepID=A0A316L196_9FLAO|nr:DUF6268 family outer membrane beta-barrel protein [Allomuricauda koreensis]PWL38699.1 hypothetical protein DKG77_10650 [Allomuricauda koreensis]